MLPKAIQKNLSTLLSRTKKNIQYPLPPCPYKSVPKAPEERLAMVASKLACIGCKLISTDTTKLKGQTKFLCLTCNVERPASRLDALLRIKRPQCCKNKARHWEASKKIDKIAGKNHYLVVGAVDSCCEQTAFICTKHGFCFLTTAEGYAKATCGVAPCCVRAAFKGAVEARGGPQRPG
jgi:hypothetical protein